jgi:hypothetical protein
MRKNEKDETEKEKEKEEMTRSLTRAAFGAAVVTGALSLPLAAQQAVRPAIDVMSVAQENELVKTRCVTCHNNRQRKGGLSFETFDAAHLDPSVARMMMIKVADDGAMMAAGAQAPDRQTVDAFVGALAAGISRTAPVSTGWTVDLTVDPLTPDRGHSFVTARAVQEVPLPTDARSSAVYQLTLSCNGAVRRANVQLLTYTKAAPGVPLLPRSTPVAPSLASPLSADALNVRDLFPGEQVAFPIGRLSPMLRDLFSWCFAGPDAGNRTP